MKLSTVLCGPFHRRIHRILTVAFIAAGVSATALDAQPAAETGVITGRVQSGVSGQYLNNARVSIQGTTTEVFTDDTGSFRITGVRPGPATLDVYFTGLDPQQVTVEVPAGGTVERNISLGSQGRYGKDEKVLKLDPFVVSNSRVTEGAALAVNEQRFAANLKNVISTDAYGDITEGNVAEFMKFMPGIAVEYEGDAPTTIQVRGFNASMTTVSVDGAQVANAVRTGASREFHFKQVSINDTSRIEVTKVPTPANRSDTLGGSVNLISKSAFERDRAQFNYNLYLGGNSRALTLDKTPHTTNENTYKMIPGGSFDLTVPITENFGIILTGLASTQYVYNSYDSRAYNVAGTATGASIAAPYLQSYSVVDFPGYHNRYSLSLKADWRVTPNSVLSANIQSTYYQDFNGNNTIAFNAGANANPTPASGVKFSYGPDFTIGAAGRGAITMSNNHSHIMGQANLGGLRYRIDKGDWHVDANLNYSTSRTWRRYLSWGNFRGLNVAMITPFRVELHDNGAVRPASVLVFDNNNNPIDYHDINRYRVTGATANSSGDVREKIAAGDLNVRRQFGFFSFPFSLQAGLHEQVQIRSTRIKNYNWTYAAPGGNSSAAPFFSPVYGLYKDYPSVGKIPWVSPEVAYELWQKDPSLFYKTPAQMVDEEEFARLNSEYIKENTQAYYIQADMRLMNNKLRILTGVRYENTDDAGKGPLVDNDAVYVKNADGTFAHTSSGARIRKPEAGAVGSMEELQLTTHERAAAASRSYDGYYPSFHLTYNFTDNLLVRLAYAKTYGRPDFDSVIPNTIITQNDDVDEDPSAIGGTITIRNTGLSPWTADNYDLSLEYYTNSGGVFSAGAFTKDIKNFFGDVVTQATQADLDALGLDSRYVGWTLRTKFNAGDARISGVEGNVRQSLRVVRFLGDWGRYFEVFANATKLNLEGDRNADFTGFLPFSLNWGVTYSRKPLTVSANWNHRGQQPIDPFPTAGPDGYSYWDERTTLDLSASYQFTPRLSLYASARNIFNVKPLFIRYSSVTPDYAKTIRTENYGVKFAIGIKGTF